MLALSFLGTSRYEETTHIWRDDSSEESCTTRFMPVAVAKIWQPARLLIFLTKEVRQHSNWHDLQEELSQLGQPVEAIEIPKGRSTEELWELLHTLLQSVPDGEEVVLDVTHSYRSLPLLATVAALSLRRIRRVRVREIIYGAYEAKDETTQRTPIFKLTSFVDMVEWLTGFDVLNNYGDGRLLGKQLTNMQDEAWRQSRVDAPRHLKRLGKALTNFTEAVWLNRALDALREAANVTQSLEQAQAERAQRIPPLSQLLHDLSHKIGEIAYANSRQLSNENLRAQFALIRYSLEAGLVPQAITLAREWLVSWYILTQAPERKSEWLQQKSRAHVEKELNESWSQLRQGKLPEGQDPLQTAISVWGELIQLRNDVAHCGMREDAISAEGVHKSAQSLIEERLATLIPSSP